MTTLALAHDDTAESLLAWAQSLAHHEAGHACVALSLGVPVFYATTVPRYDCSGHVRHMAIQDMTVQTALLITLAGPAAQRRFFPWQQQFADDVDDTMGGFDTTQARALLSILNGTDQVLGDVITVALARWRARADQAVTRHWPWIVAVANALEQRRRLSGDEIACLHPGAQRQRQVVQREV